jgi:alkylhydroperoxidase family enzyme
MYERYKDQATFLTIYVREAHPLEGWRMESNDKAGVLVAQPKTEAERTKVAGTCCAALKMTIPLLVDTIDDRVGHAYSGMPDRLYVIDRGGKVAYQGGRGPFGFKPGEMEQALMLLLLEQAPAKSAPRVPMLKTDEAWKRLPATEKGQGQALPAWARATAASLPRTTAAMLELDYLHRAESSLAPRLRGMMRWAAADANRCPTTAAQALADLQRAGVERTDIDLLLQDAGQLPLAERDAVAFARKLTSAAYTVTDEEVAQLLKTHGEKNVVAMVQLLAHANFQDRLILALGLGSEEPLPPLDVKFVKKGIGAAAPPRQPPPPPLGPGPAARITDPEWLALDASALQKNLALQRGRAPRIRVPSWEELARQNPDAPARKIGIKWSLVCSGYQPRLAQGWSACTGGFREDAHLDRAFEELQFWIVTRSLYCFY